MRYMHRTTIPARTSPGLTRSALPLMAQGCSVKLAMGRERGVKGGLVSLRIGSVNVTSMKKSDGEVVDMAARRRLDFCCLQETGWKGEGARKLGKYKFFWMGCAMGIHEVGLLVRDRWIEKVLEVKRVSKRLMVVRVNCMEDCAELDFCICATSWKTYAGERRILHLFGEDCVGDK